MNLSDSESQWFSEMLVITFDQDPVGYFILFKVTWENFENCLQ